MIVNGTNGPVIEGFLGEVWREITDVMKLQWTVEHVEEQYGISTDGDKTFSGMIGRVHRGEADIAIADFFQTISRGTVVDFSLPVYVTDACYFTKMPSEATTWETFIVPLTTNSWFATFVVMLFGSICLSLPHKALQNKVQDLDKDFWWSVFAIVTAITQQGQYICCCLLDHSTL